MPEKNTHIIKNKQLFAERFRALRKKVGLSQRKLAELLNLTGNTQISKFEKGLSEPSLEILRKLTDLFAVDLHFFITGDKSPAALQLERAQLKILTDRMKYLGTKLGNILKDRETRANELEDNKKRLANGEDVEPEFIEILESDIQAYDNELRTLAENVPWVKEAIESIIDKK